jgi:hypothetical protein
MAGSFARHRIEEVEELIGTLEEIAGSLSTMANLGKHQDSAEVQALWSGSSGINSVVTRLKETMADLDRDISGLEALAGISAEKPQGAAPGPVALPA